MGPDAKRLIVCVHDVAPPFEEDIRAQLGILAAAGVRRCALNVVPNWHGEYPLAESPSLIALLRSQAEGGSEIVLHGLEHRPHGPLRGSAWNRFRGCVFAPGTAEFLTLAPADAFRAVEEGLRVLEAAGLPRPTRFCAPGWLLAVDARGGLARAGIEHLVGMFSVENILTRRRRFLPGFGYMGGSEAQEAGIRILNRMILTTAGRAARPLSVYLHPQGGSRNPALRRVLHQIERMVSRGWEPSTYAEVSRES
jgi:predicted deacetylase